MIKKTLHTKTKSKVRSKAKMSAKDIRHIIHSKHITRAEVDKLFKIASKLEKGNKSPLKGKVMASLFYEPSTRTRFSFESAMVRLGGHVLTTENGKEFSSAAKGETLEDSIKVMNHYADVIVMRHYEQGAAERAGNVSNVPVINAGDGPGQHPTQALLDLYTIYRELGKIDGIKIAMVGDLKHGRTVRSLALMLGKYKGVEIIFVSPKELKMGEDIKEYLHEHNITFSEETDLEKIIGSVDVLYQTRVQKERFTDPKMYEKCKGKYILTLKHAEMMKQNAIIMHPLPRIDEIHPEVDASHHAKYFDQARYGVLMRMALLMFVLGVELV